MSAGDGWLARAARAWRERILEHFCLIGRRTWERDACEAVDCESLGLTQMAVGETGTVTCLVDPASPESRRLAALGVLPGARLGIEQRRPVYVVRIGHGQVALDREMARCVRLRREGNLAKSS